MNPDSYLLYSSTGCNFSLIPPKPKIPVLTVRREMYPFRFNDNASKNHGNMSSGLKQNEKFSLEVEIQFVRESDKSTINTIRRRAVVDHRLTLADLPAQLLTELGCIIDPSLGQVEVFGLRLLDWSCLIPLDVVSEDLSSSTVGDKLSVLINYLLFFYRVSIKNCREITSVEVWSIIGDLVKRYSAEGAYHRLKQMNCPLLKTNSTIFYEFLFQSSAINLDSLDQVYQLSFLDTFSFDNWYRSFPINQFLNGVKSLQTNLFSQHSLDPSVNSSAFEKLTSSLSEVLRQKNSINIDISQSSIDKSCDSIIQEALMKMKSDSNHFPLSEKTCCIESSGNGFAEETFSDQKTSSEASSSFPRNQFKTVDCGQIQLLENPKSEKRKVRNRVTFVVEDLKQLEEWFKENPRPSREKFQQYAVELNRRHQNNHNKAKRTLHARNIVYWFKNARAAYKRMTAISPYTTGEQRNSRITENRSSDPSIIDNSESFDEHHLNFKQENIDQPTSESGYTHIKSVDSEASMENVFLQHESGSLTDIKESTSVSSDFEQPDDIPNVMTDNEIVSGISDFSKPSKCISSEEMTIKNPLDDANYRTKEAKIGKSSLTFRGAKRRARIFLDPTTEVNRLEQWFQVEKYPDIIQIENYTNILNMSPYRQNHFRKLVPENVTLWFKNRRARLKRCSNVTTQLNT